MKDHLKYYKSINNIPTVNLGDLNKKILFNQRKNFYFNLSIGKNNFLNRSVLELCAGTGYNAKFLIEEFKIKEITCLDYNPSSIQHLKKNLSGLKNAKIKNVDLFKFRTKRKFDFVIIENAIDNFKNEKKIAKKLISLAKKKGDIIISIGDDYGIFSNKLRYIFSLILLEQNKIEKFDEQVNFLKNIFKDHLRCLSKNTRKADKWVLDNMLNAEWIKKKNYINYPSFIRYLNNKAIIKCTSPSFHNNFKWYKNLEILNINKNYLKSYHEQKINFIDFETRFKIKIDIDQNIKKIYKNIYKLNFKKKIDIKIIKNIDHELNKIIKKIKFKNKVYFALTEFSKILKKFMANKKIKSNTKYFKSLWGIYNQNILLSKI